MQVILIKTLRKKGKIGDIIDVKDGYGRNYLLPQSIAIRASKENINNIEQQKKLLLKQNDVLKKEAEIAMKKLQGTNLIFVMQASADGRLFGSVSKKMIAEELSKKSGFTLDYSHIDFDIPIKLIGINTVEVSYHSDVRDHINVVTARSDSEAQQLIDDMKAEKEAKLQKDNSAQDAVADVQPEKDVKLQEDDSSTQDDMKAKKRTKPKKDTAQDAVTDVQAQKEEAGGDVDIAIAASSPAKKSEKSPKQAKVKSKS